MTDQAKPGRPPVHDLSAFDLTKRSPEQLAQSFARWKAQRKRRPEAMRASPPLHASRNSVTVQDAARDPLTSDETVAAEPSPANRAVHYSEPFSALLAAGSEPAVQRTLWTPVTARPLPNRSASPRRRLKAMTILAGAASVLALAGGMVLELSDWRGSTEAEPELVQVHPPELPKAQPIAAAAMKAPVAEWTLRRTVDMALMKPAPAANAVPPVQPTPKPPKIQTASKAASPSAASKPASSQPIAEKDASKAAQFVAKPFVPAPTSAVTPAAQKTAVLPAPPVTAVIRSGDPRPDALFQHGRDKSTAVSSTGAVSNRVAAGAKPAEAAKSKAADARTAAARSATASGTGSGDPRGEGSGGARIGPSADGGIGGAAGGGDASGAAGGNADGDGTTGSGSASGDAGGGDTGGTGAGSSDPGGADTGGSNAGGGGTGGSNAGGSNSGSNPGGSNAGGSNPGGSSAGGSNPGGDGTGDGAGSGDGGSGGGESDSNGGEDGDSGGIGGAIGGALGGVGDALGGALGGGN